MLQLLESHQIDQRIRRLAMEICERHSGQPDLILVGINNNGYHFASLLAEALGDLPAPKTQLTRIRLNPASPRSERIEIEFSHELLQGARILLIDDVANTGRTLFYAFTPLLDVIPKSVEVAVLIDRMHKSYPVEVNYYGVQLATTIQDDIIVKLQAGPDRGVYLQ